MQQLGALLLNYLFQEPYLDPLLLIHFLPFKIVSMNRAHFGVQNELGRQIELILETESILEITTMVLK